jgi:hypothetical protein
VTTAAATLLADAIWYGLGRLTGRHHYQDGSEAGLRRSERLIVAKFLPGHNPLVVARLTALAGLALLLSALVAVLWPRVVVVPFAAIGVWIAAARFVRAWRQWRPAHEHAESRSPGRAGPR